MQAREELKKIRQHLLTGVSFAIPFVACGGILIAMALGFAPTVVEGHGPDPSSIPILHFMLKVGVAAFMLMLPILAAYIAYSIAGKPGLVPGAVGGYLMGDLNTKFLSLDNPDVKMVSAGFLGALVIGLFAGYIVQAIKSIPTHKYIKAIMPILVIPVVSAMAVGALTLLVIGPPIAEFNVWLGSQLTTLGNGNKVALAMVLGAMIAFDMGGPVNKAAFFFASGLIAQGNASVMGPVAAAICTPPIGMGLATMIGRKLWTQEQRESGIAAMAMGTIGITEGAIPFAASDPLRVIPCIMLGSMVASVICMLAGVQDHAPHGGLIVLPVITGQLAYIIGIAAGVLTTALAINTLKTIGQRKKGDPQQPTTGMRAAA